jgi:hypothetical protein
MTGKTFAVMKTNVGDMLQDTTSAFATLIGVWINDAYIDAWRRGVWADLIDDDFTFTAVIDQAEYSFATDLSITDFGKEIILADITNGHMLKRYTIRDWWQERAVDYKNESLDSGNPVRYSIIPEDGKIKLDPPPDSADEYAMPYQKEVANLSGDSDTPGITTISTYLERYAIGMGAAYKRQYQKSTWWLNLAEQELRKLIAEENVKINQRFQRKSSGWQMPKLRRLLGENSYDTI